MKLPHADQAVVERAKIVDYLLNPAHPDNGGKARFFTGLGFRRGEWEQLASALRAWPARRKWYTTPTPHMAKNML